MGQRGPHSRPAALKMADGTYRADRDASIPMGDGIPDLPDWLSESAAEVWQSVVAELSAVSGLLAKVDGHALARYCEDWAEYLETQKTIDSEGRYAVSKSGNTYQHPAVGIRNRAAERMMKFEARFGMTPSDRTGMKIEKPKAGVRRRQV